MRMVTIKLRRAAKVMPLELDELKREDNATPIQPIGRNLSPRIVIKAGDPFVRGSAHRSTVM